MIHGFDVYRTYLAFKQHFSNPNFDFFKYEGKVNAKEETYHQRTDFYFFETLARKLNAQEVNEYMLASFVSANDPTKVWIGDIKRSGKEHWSSWQKLFGSLSYIFSSDCKHLVGLMGKHSYKFNDLLTNKGGHPPLLKAYLRGDIHLETIIIMDMILGFTKQWDAMYRDPMWEGISFKIKKYKPFLSIQTIKYRKVLKDTFL